MSSTKARRLAELWRGAQLDPEFAARLESIPATATRITELEAELEAQAAEHRRDLLARIIDGDGITAADLLAPAPDLPAALRLLDEAKARATDSDLWRALAERGVFDELESAETEIVARVRELAVIVGDCRTGDQALDRGGEVASAWAELRRLNARRDDLIRLDKIVTPGLSAAKFPTRLWRTPDPGGYPRKPQSEVDRLLMTLAAEVPA